MGKKILCWLAENNRPNKFAFVFIRSKTFCTYYGSQKRLDQEENYSPQSQVSNGPIFILFRVAHLLYNFEPSILSCLKNLTCLKA